MAKPGNKRKRKKHMPQAQPVEQTIDDITYDQGTPETRKNARNNNTLDYLIRSRRVGGVEIEAAKEIRKIYLELTRRLLPRSGDMSRPVLDMYSNDKTWFIDAYPRYKAWTVEIADKGPALEICIDIIVEFYSASKVDAMRSVRKGTSVNLMIEALREYAMLSGWADRDRWPAPKVLVKKPSRKKTKSKALDMPDIQ